jgi:GT2 family glycosyltransferase
VPDVDVSIIVVNYRTHELTLACIESVLQETTGHGFEIIVVDNDSQDGSAERIAQRFPECELIASGENLGFAKANNLAAKRSKGKRILLLNPDTVVRGNAVDRILDFADAHPDARLWGGRTIFADGTLNPTSCWGRPSPWAWLSRGVGLARLFPGTDLFDPEPMRRWDRTTVRQVPVITGCFLLIDRSLWEELDGFDPRFHMYGEDVDLCLRAEAAGARPLVTPDACIVHYGGKSERVKEDQLVRQFAAKTRLAQKHWTGLSQVIGRFAIRCWAFNRMCETSVLGLVSKRHGDDSRIWKSVWRRRAEWT